MNKEEQEIKDYIETKQEYIQQIMEQVKEDEVLREYYYFVGGKNESNRLI